MKKIILFVFIMLLTTIISSCVGDVPVNYETDFSRDKILCKNHNYVNNVCQSCNCSLWSGEVDTSWYSAVKKEFEITTAEQLAGFASLDFRKQIKTGR